MNKKEQAEMADLRNDLRRAKALRFTDSVARDVPPPDGFGELSKGFNFNSHSIRVSKACSSSVSHSDWSDEETDSQRPRWLFSTDLKAWQAMRNELEQRFAEELAKVDQKIEELKGKSCKSIESS